MTISFVERAWLSLFARAGAEVASVWGPRDPDHAPANWQNNCHHLKSSRMPTQHFPVIVEQDEDGFFVAECPLFEGCYAQGKSYAEALKNIKAVIQLCQSEQQSTRLRHTDVSLTMVTI